MSGGPRGAGRGAWGSLPPDVCGLLPDLIVQAKSGTGKTCVFSTIALDALLLDSPATQVSAGSAGRGRSAALGRWSLVLLEWRSVLWGSCSFGVFL